MLLLKFTSFLPALFVVLRNSALADKVRMDEEEASLSSEANATLLRFDKPTWRQDEMEDDDAIEAVANDNSRWDRMAHGDVNMRVLQKGEVIQLERKGYFIVDEPYTKPGKPIVLFLIPDGREKKVAFPAKAT